MRTQSTVDSGLRRFNTALGAAEETLVAVPPFTFPGVTSRVFPLRASLNILRAFCKNYLKADGYEFLPYFPYVFLVVLDYGRMGIEQFNMGWVSQHEILFEVPLGMWRIDGGRRTFVKWVVNTPFIVVDNATSLTTGRETFGWPKVLATLETDPERWLIDPRNSVRYLTLDFIGLDSHHPNVRLLEIDQQTGQNAPLFPPDLDMLDPFGRISRFARTSMTLWFDMAELLVGAPLSGFGRNRPGERGEVLFDSFRRLSGFYGDPGVDVVTLKQFRDAEDPTQVCYQALVESRLSVARFNRGGLLGQYNLLQGDITGGFRIRLHDHPAFPIVASLGLEVTEERTVRGNAVSFLEPIYPFWTSVDLTYGKGRTLCWRTRNQPWQRERTPRQAPPVNPSGKAFFNTTAGGAEQVWYGPYVIPKASYEIYALKADPQRLGDFLERYLSADEYLTVVLEGDCVYMVASANRMFSQARSRACIVASQIAFYVPLRLSYLGTEKHVLATPFAFVDNPVLATTMREVQGVPAMNAKILAPSRFLSGAEPVLKMQADVFSAIGAGLRCEQQTLLEVWPGGAGSTPGGAAFSSEAEASELFDPVFQHVPPPTPREQQPPAERRVLKERLMLKQFRDADEPELACYQSLVLEPWTVMTRTDPEPLPHGMTVRVYRYPSLPLVETLGLVSAAVEAPSEGAGAVADVLVCEQAYRIELTVEIGLGEEFRQTAGAGPWMFL